MKIDEPNELFLKVKKNITKNDIFIILVVLVLGIINNFSFFITEGIAMRRILKGYDEKHKASNCEKIS